MWRLPLACSIIVLAACGGAVAADRTAKPEKAAAGTASASATAIGTAPAPAAPTAASDRWQEMPGKDAMSDKPSMALHLFADDTLGGTANPAVLVLRCSNAQTEAYIIAGAARTEYGNSGRATVRLRYDDRPVVEENWGESTDYSALFSPHAIAFAKRLEAANRLRFQFESNSHGSLVFQFDVRGLASHIGKVASTCGWQP